MVLVSFVYSNNQWHFSNRRLNDFAIAKNQYLIEWTLRALSCGFTTQHFCSAEAYARYRNSTANQEVIIKCVTKSIIYRLKEMCLYSPLQCWVWEVEDGYWWRSSLKCDIALCPAMTQRLWGSPTRTIYFKKIRKLSYSITGHLSGTLCDLSIWRVLYIHACRLVTPVNIQAGFPGRCHLKHNDKTQHHWIVYVSR